MDIEDLRSVKDGPIDADLCLVGSGPAGWMIAEELKYRGLRILMLESGGHTTAADMDALNEIEDLGTPLFNGRSRVLGRTSRVWSGRCMPFDDVDYEKRDWVPRSGWLFTAATMAPHVNRAGGHLGAGPYYAGTRRRPIPDGSQPRPPVDPSLLRPLCWKVPPTIDFGRLLAASRGANLRVLVRATVSHLNTDSNAREVASVEVADANGRRLTVRFRGVVLCAGGIENARILLYSDRSAPGGLGNAHDVVGRYVMDHSRDFQLIAQIDTRDANRFRDLFGPSRVRGAQGSTISASDSASALSGNAPRAW